MMMMMMLLLLFTRPTGKPSFCLNYSSLYYSRKHCKTHYTFINKRWYLLNNLHHVHMFRGIGGEPVEVFVHLGHEHVRGIHTVHAAHCFCTLPSRRRMDFIAANFCFVCKLLDDKSSKSTRIKDDIAIFPQILGRPVFEVSVIDWVLKSSRFRLIVCMCVRACVCACLRACICVRLFNMS